MPSSPPIEAYTIVASASKPGFLEVALDDLKGYLSVLIFKYGSATIQSVKLLYTQCDAVSKAISLLYVVQELLRNSGWLLGHNQRRVADEVHELLKTSSGSCQMRRSGEDVRESAV